MKMEFEEHLLPKDAILFTCSSHEPRCKGLIGQLNSWTPKETVLFHYDDANASREEHHAEMVSGLRRLGSRVEELRFTEGDAVKSLHGNIGILVSKLKQHPTAEIVLDISVFTKRHLLMMLRWLDDEGYWDRMAVTYTEPEEFDVTEFIPLSFGLRSLQQVPGFTACPDISRPVHLVLFLGYEGDRALAVYEQVQPMNTTIVITDPPYRPDWKGRSEYLNRNLLTLVGPNCSRKADGIDPSETERALEGIFGSPISRSAFAKVVCPIGTKPQTFGIYSYVRHSEDPPAVVYASPLRHNHDFFSRGIGKTWLIKSPI